MAEPARIALDAFGTDACPGPEIAGAIGAAKDGVHVILVGDKHTLKPALRDAGGGDLPISIHHAPDTIAMSDSPSKAVRGKPDASMPKCFDLVKSGDAEAVMSAGNSGAMLACGLFKYRRIKGVDRPALVTTLPTREGVVTFLDVGANVECRPINLTQFAVLGAIYSRFKDGIARPKVAVLSNGTEEGKGTDLTRAANRLLEDHPSEDFEYAGYAEGNDLFSGEFDVIVADGFSGNVALKIAEATGRLIAGWVKRGIESSLRSKIGALLMRPALMQLKTALDPDTYGAAPLLGVGGLAFICHGSASPFAIANSLKWARRSVRKELGPQLADAIVRHKPLFEASRAVEVA
jgi:glycerol-3-phosphate acyltransferase PlsX